MRERKFEFGYTHFFIDGENVSEEEIEELRKLFSLFPQYWDDSFCDINFSDFPKKLVKIAVNARGFVREPLILMAASHVEETGRLESLIKMIELGANIETQSRRGWTSLQHAIDLSGFYKDKNDANAQIKHDRALALAQCLLEHGARVDVKLIASGKELSMRDYVALRGSPEMQALIEKRLSQSPSTFKRSPRPGLNADIFPPLKNEDGAKQTKHQDTPRPSRFAPTR